MLYSNFTQQVWYTPLNQRDDIKPARFLLQTIPYRFTSLVDISLHEDESFYISVDEFILQNCVLDYQNVMTDLPKDVVLKNLADSLGKELTRELIDKVFELWAPTPNFLSEMVTTVELMVDPRFNDGTWHCATCQARGLDKQRNCPYLSSEYVDPMFKLPFMGETITMCPVDKKDETLGKVILEGYNFREINQLPESGGVGDQAILYVIGVQHLAERLKHFQRQADDDAIKSAR